MATATFGCGCFWCAEAIFDRVEGVTSVRSGFSGGRGKDPSYELVCTGTTGHAEVVQVEYDPAKVSYAELLRVFFGTHDPTTKNRQGHDVGSQYRSIILTHDDEQRRVAEDVKAKLDASGVYPNPIVTEIVPFEAFYPADAHHQDYFAQNPGQGYCQAVIRPKVEKFEQAFQSILKGQAKPAR